MSDLCLLAPPSIYRCAANEILTADRVMKTIGDRTCCRLFNRTATFGSLITDRRQSNRHQKLTYHSAM